MKNEYTKMYFECVMNFHFYYARHIAYTQMCQSNGSLMEAWKFSLYDGASAITIHRWHLALDHSSGNGRFGRRE